MNTKLQMAFLGALCCAVAIPSWAQGECYDAFLSEDWNAAYRSCLPLAARGDAEAQYNFGIMHLLGMGVTKDYMKAHAWISLAGAHGYDGTGGVLDLLETSMSFDEITEAKRQADQWLWAHENASGQ